MVKHISKVFDTTAKAVLALGVSDSTSSFTVLGAALDSLNPENDILMPASIISGNFGYLDSEFNDVETPDKYAICIRIRPVTIAAGSSSSSPFENEDGLVTLEKVTKITPIVQGQSGLAPSLPYKYHTKTNDKYYVSAVGFINNVNTLDPTNGPVLPTGKTLDNFSTGLLPVQNSFFAVPPTSGQNALMGRVHTFQIGENNEYINNTQLLLSCGPTDLFQFSYSVDPETRYISFEADIDTSLFNLISPDTAGNMRVMLPRIGGQMLSILSSDPTKMYVKADTSKFVFGLLWDIGVVDMDPDPGE